MNCRTCNHALGEHAVADGTTKDPGPGDLSVCLYCGAVSVFRGNGSATAPTYQELDEMTRDPAAIEAMHLALLLRQKLAEMEKGDNN